MLEGLQTLSIIDDNKKYKQIKRVQKIMNGKIIHLMIL